MNLEEIEKKLQKEDKMEKKKRESIKKDIQDSIMEIQEKELTEILIQIMGQQKLSEVNILNLQNHQKKFYQALESQTMEMKIYQESLETILKKIELKIEDLKDSNYALTESFTETITKETNNILKGFTGNLKKSLEFVLESIPDFSFVKPMNTIFIFFITLFCIAGIHNMFKNRDIISELKVQHQRTINLLYDISLGNKKWWWSEKDRQAYISNIEYIESKK